MRIVVTTNGRDLEAPVSPVFGRCPIYILVDSETMAFEAFENPAVGASGGAGVQAAQFVIGRGAEAVVTGNVGPNAFQVFETAGVPVYPVKGGTVREAVEAFRQGELDTAGGATAPDHAGMGRGRGMGGQRAAVTPPPPASSPAREEEIAALKDMAGALRAQLAEILERIDRLEEGE